MADRHDQESLREDVEEFRKSEDGKDFRILDCENPKSFPVRRRVDGGGPEVPADQRSYLTEYRALGPCCKCASCQRTLKNEWYGRAMAEFHSYGSAREHSFLTLTLSDEGRRSAGLDFKYEWDEDIGPRLAYSKLRVLISEEYKERDGDKDVPSWVYHAPGPFDDPARQAERHTHIINWWRRKSAAERAKMLADVYGDNLEFFERELFKYRDQETFRRDGRRLIISQFTKFLDRLRYEAKKYINEERKRLKDVNTSEAREYLSFLDTIYDKHPRYLMVSEYGDTTGRLHYHAIFYAWLSCQGQYEHKIHKGKVISECQCNICKMVEKAWGLGFTTFEPVGDPEKSAFYVTKYILKQNQRDDLVPDYFPASAHAASRKPPLGSGVMLATVTAMLASPYGVKYAYDKLLKNGIQSGNKTFNLGRNALRRMRILLGDTDPTFLDAVKNDTAEQGRIAAHNSHILPVLAEIEHGAKRARAEKRERKQEHFRQMKSRANK